MMRRNHIRTGGRIVPVLACVSAVALGPFNARAQEASSGPEAAAAPVFTVDGRIALRALTALSDAHLRKIADMLTLLAATDAARSCDWERIRAPLLGAGSMSVPAVHWFALPNGTYWTVEQGRASAWLSDRPYFPRVLAGETVIGDLVVSRSSSRNTAIVAVPVKAQDGAVIGVLGASVHLDSLAAVLREELGGLDDRLLFFAIDGQALGALNSDAGLIFTEPMKLGDEGMRRAFTEILSGTEGVVTYTFRGALRTVLYRKSPVSGWWYGFGEIGR